VYLYFFHGPVRIRPTLFGKLTGVLTTVLLGFLLLGLSSWSDQTRHSMKEVFDVGLGVMGLATIIQVVFIGLANRSEAPDLIEVEALPATSELPAKVSAKSEGRGSGSGFPRGPGPGVAPASSLPPAKFQPSPQCKFEVACVLHDARGGRAGAPERAVVDTFATSRGSMA